MSIRKAVGWLVAEAYVLFGRRRERCARCRSGGLIVPVLMHGPTSERLCAVLSELDRLVGLKNVELTFDDGRRELLQCLPVLERFGVRSVWFVSPGEILNGYNWAERARMDPRLDLGALSRMSAAERAAELHRVGADGRGNELLTVEDIRRLANHPLVSFGNHTWSHLSCTNRPLDEVLDEIDRTQRQIFEWTGRVPTEFSYPFGHGSAELDGMLRSRGLTPHSIRPGFVTTETRGSARNMIYERYSLAEDVGRALTAWPPVRGARQ